MGARARRLLWTGMSVVQKWAVLPVSAMAGVVARVAGGPIAGTGGGVGNSGLSLVSSFGLLSVIAIGFPPFQGTVVGAELGTRRRCIMRVEPPIMLREVAAS